MSAVKIWLAPMEGVVDHTLRHFWSALGGYDHCVTEFVRVTQHPIPKQTFLKYSPELLTGGKTSSGTPVRVQLLGSDIENLCLSAQTAARLGSPGIDLNFGCPAPSVNKHDGGAVLLKEPDRIYRIVRAVREALPAAIELSAKMRLGFDSSDLCLANAEAVAAGGAHLLTLHCRTKIQMYRPPVDWTWAAKIKAKTALQVVVNGDIWTQEDARLCQNISGCDSIMLGRSALKNPWLAGQIKGLVDEEPHCDARRLLLALFDKVCETSDRFAVARIKQLVRFQSEQLFEDIRRLQTPAEIKALLSHS